MAAAAGLFMNVLGMGESAGGGAKAKEAGEVGAQSIMSETQTNIEQTKKTQAQTLGIATALAAASGIKFDARKIGKVKFSEGGLTTRTETEKEWQAGTIYNQDYTTEEMIFGGASFFEKERDVSVTTASEDIGRQIAGEEEGGSTFTYLREMKKEFAKDIGWQAKQGASRAKVARLGGTVAYAQSKASVYQQGAGAAQSAANWWGKSPAGD